MTSAPMKLLPIVIIFCLGSLAACSRKAAVTGEKAETGTPPSPEETAKIESQFVPPPNQAKAATVQERLNGAVHPGLTLMLQAFVASHGRMPESIYEFGNAMDSMPQAPPGMKYMIDPADKSVKVVRK